MTTRGKIVLTILLLGVVGFGVYRWWDKIAPQSKPQNQSVDVAQGEEGYRAKAERRRPTFRCWRHQRGQPGRALGRFRR